MTLCGSLSDLGRWWWHLLRWETREVVEVWTGKPSLKSARFEVPVMRSLLSFLFEAFAFSLPFKRTKSVALGWNRLQFSENIMGFPLLSQSLHVYFCQQLCRLPIFFSVLGWKQWTFETFYILHRSTIFNLFEYILFCKFGFNSYKPLFFFAKIFFKLRIFFLYIVYWQVS